MRIDSPKPEMKITALAPWFGSKRTLAPRIVRELGKHKSYWENPCGSMAVLLSKPACGMEVVNDLHGDLINLARVIASDRAVELYARAARTLTHSEIFEECKATCFGDPMNVAQSMSDISDEHLDRAYRFFVMSWQARNGSGGTLAGNVTVARRFTHNGGAGGLRWMSAVDSIPAWHERLRSVQILRMDAIELLDRVGDQDGTVIYADPPYLEKTEKYTHDFENFGGGLLRDDHDAFADALKRFKRARVIVSYYDHPRLSDLYAGWTKVNCPVAKSLVNQSKRDREGEAVTAPEILLINGPSYTGGSAS